MNAKILTAIESYAGLFSLDAASSPERLALSSFYTMLRGIMEAKLLPSKQPGREFEAHLPRPLQELNRRAREAFRADHNGEIKQRLGELVAYLETQESVLRLAESRLLLLKARHWLRHLEGHLRPGSFSVSLAPSLDLTLYEEDLTRGGEASREILVTMAWLYEGPVPATEIRVFFEGHDLDVRADGQENRVNGQRFVSADAPVFDGATFTTSFRLRHHGTGSLRCWLQYTNHLTTRTALSEAPKEYHVEESSSSPPLRLSNPFVPDAPIHSDVHWKPLAKGKHGQLADRLTEELSQANRFVALRGLRRSGKTTILLRARQSLSRISHILPVYINIHSWRLTLEKQGFTLTKTGLLYEIADSTLCAAEKLDMPAENADAFLREFEDGMRLREQRDFHHFLKLFQRATNRVPVFLLDNLDAWLHTDTFTQDSENLLTYLRGLADEGECSVAASYTWNDDDWKKRLSDQEVFPTVIPIEMLERTDIHELCRVSQYPLTQLAEELIWRLTGGWPGLAQLLLYAVHERASRSEQAVDASLVKQVTTDLLSSNDWEPLLRYLFASFNDSERRALQALASCTNLQTTEVDGVRISQEPRSLQYTGRGDGPPESSLNSLLQKQILEPTAKHSETIRLRVGVLHQNQITSF